MREYSTKRLVRAVSIFLGVLIFGFIFTKSSGLRFIITPQQAIDYLVEADYQILPEDVAFYIESEVPGYIYVDLRNPYDFFKGNVPTSVNIPQTDLLDEETLNFFDEAQKDSVIVVLISTDEAAATGPWLILKQLGYNNLKVMKGGWDYYATESLDPYDMPEVPKYMVEEPAFDFIAIMETMKSGSGNNSTGNTPEVILPERKKKHSKVEGGC